MKPRPDEPPGGSSPLGINEPVVGGLGERCPCCGYDLSLRTREQYACPECGAVAPRPSADSIDRERFERGERVNALRCLACHRPITEPCERCPACGSDDVFIRTGRDRAREHGRLRRLLARLLAGLRG